MDNKVQLPGQIVSCGAKTDWRSQLPAGIRDSLVNKLMDTMKSNLPLSGEGVLELKNIAVRYEEMYYKSADDQNDYLAKICLKMLAMETKSKNLTPDSLQSNSAASQDMQSHTENQVKQNPPIPVVRSHLLPENSQSNITSTVVPNSAGLTPGAASCQNTSMHAVENFISQGVLPSNSNNRQICESQQVAQQERKRHNHHHQHPPLKRKLSQEIIPQSFSQSQNLLQESQLQSSQHGALQPSFSQSSDLSTLQLNEPSSPLVRQHNSALDAHQILNSVHNNIFSLQQQQASSQQYDLLSMHRQQFVPQNVSDFQQQMVGVQQGCSSFQTNQKLVMLHQSEVSKQRQMQQTKPNLLPDQQTQQQQPQQLISEIQSQPGQLHQELVLQQSGNQLQGVNQPVNQLLNQWTNSPLQEMTIIDQPGPLLQLQGSPKLPLTSFVSSSQLGSIDGVDWVEEFLQKFRSMDGADLPELSEIYQRLDHYSLLQQPKNERLEQLRYHKFTMDWVMMFLLTDKSDVQPNHWEKIEVQRTSAQGSLGTTQQNDLTDLLNDSHPYDAHGIESTIASRNSNVVEQPIERLIKVMKSMSYKALSTSVSDITSVVSMADMLPGSTPWNGSQAAVGEDLAATTNCRLLLDGPSCTKKMRRYTSAMPSNVISST